MKMGNGSQLLGAGWKLKGTRLSSDTGAMQLWGGLRDGRLCLLPCDVGQATKPL